MSLPMTWCTVGHHDAKRSGSVPYPAAVANRVRPAARAAAYAAATSALV